MSWPALPSHRELLKHVPPAREKWRNAPRPAPEVVGPGEVSVWSYPRPPLTLAGFEHLFVTTDDGTPVAETRAPVWICETAGAPVPYFPPADVSAALIPTDRISICEWKGAAVGLDLRLSDGRILADVAWVYPDPLDDLGQNYAAIAGHIAFYPARLACWQDGERVRPQPGGYYGGWVTDRIKGPIKGAPGTGHW